MSQQTPENSDSQQPDANSTQQADSSAPENVVQGNQNRVVQGEDNKAVLGDGNTAIQGNNNLLVTIKELILGQQLAPVGNPQREHNQRLLLADVKQEVASRLRQSLHNAVLINLGKESQPQQVKRPWDAEIKIGLKPAEPLSNTATILEVFDSQDVAGKLLILGAPGAGKTTTQLELAQALVKRAEEQLDYPVPVLFNLSSWKDDRQSITYWLLAELNSKYGISKKLGQKWVNNHQLLPLLDGLDELESQRQELCVHAINQFLASETKPLSLVVCSRIEEYSNYSSNFHLNGAIYLRELNETQISEYFKAVGRVEFWQILQPDETLFKLMRTPLFLSITVLSVQELSIEDWQRLETMEVRIEHLFDAYWRQQMFNRDHAKELYVIKNRLRFFFDKYIRRLSVEPGIKPYIQHKPPIPKQTKLWLIWLAQLMQRESKTEFLIEEMQPYWLPNNFHVRIYRFIYGLGIGIFYQLILFILPLLFSSFFLFFKPSSNLRLFNSFPSTLFNGIVLGSEIGIFFAIFLNIKNNFKNRIICGLFYAVITEAIHLIRDILHKDAISLHIPHFWMFAMGTLFFGFRVFQGGLIFALFVENSKKIKTVEIMNFAWKKFTKSLLKGMIIGLIFGFIASTGLVLILVYYFPVYYNTPSDIPSDFIPLLILIFGTSYGIIAGIIFGLFFGFFNGFNTRNIEIKAVPNQAIWTSAMNAVISSLIFGGIVGGIVGGLDFVANGKLIRGLIVGLIFGLIFGLNRGGGACIYHFVLRLILYHNGYIPWNYARFLDYCTERLFLQRVGGRYRFIHKLLQDHFAKMEFKRN